MPSPDPSPAATSVETIYASHHCWLKGWLHRKLNNASDAADLMQDTFLRLMQSRYRNTPQPQPRALLTHIAKGLLIDHWRRKDVEQAYLEALAHAPAQHEPSPEERYLVIEALVRIDAMLSSLQEKTRTAFLLAQIHGLTLAQISQKTGMPVITVRRHLHKALVACMSARLAFDDPPDKADVHDCAVANRC